MVHFLPARFANRFYVSDCKEVCRLSFGETIDGREELHTGIVLHPKDAVALRDLLNKIYPQEKGTIQ